MNNLFLAAILGGGAYALLSYLLSKPSPVPPPIDPDKVTKPIDNTIKNAPVNSGATQVIESGIKETEQEIADREKEIARQKTEIQNTESTPVNPEVISTPEAGKDFIDNLLGKK